ncbi:MAG: FAD-dependent oxidoreductase [Blastocatellia bacterium]|nr:FAD-dependent oxidoreductase [Blastocatellia bacterium]
MKEHARKRIVILGGGFGGIYTAKYLEKALGRRDDYEITLVNKENYFVFQPMLPEVISGTIGILDTVSPIRRLLPKTDLHVRDIESIDLENRTITTSPGFRPHSHVINYDYLVIALGNVTDFRGLRGLPEHAIPFKNLADALYIRNHIIRALEEAAIEHHDAELRRQLLTFVVAGGGFSGVEAVAEINDFVRGVAQNYIGLDPSEIRVILVHSQDRILPEMSEKLALFAQRILQKRGVEIRLNTRLEAATGQEACVAGGERIPTRTLISTVPASPHPIVESLGLPKGKNGRLIANRYLEVEGAKNIWALGDCALIPDPGGEGFAPPTAQHAIRQGRTAAGNIVAAIRGGERRTFDFKGLGTMGALGHRSAVAEIFGMKISGFVAWWMWRSIYLMKLPGWGRRLKVATDWTLDLLLPPELVQLRLAGSMGITQEHFEPGEEVFHQGDLGDRIYIIVTGQADVLREDKGQETVLAHLEAGQYFGEMALLKKTTRTATVRCTAPMDTLSLPKREFSLLTSYLPELRKEFEMVMEERNRDNLSKMAQAGNRPDGVKTMKADE